MPLIFFGEAGLAFFAGLGLLAASVIGELNRHPLTSASIMQLDAEFVNTFDSIAQLPGPPNYLGTHPPRGPLELPSGNE